MGSCETQGLDIVKCRGVQYKLLPGVFYHFTTPGGCLLWNARLAEGLISSISEFSDATGISGATTPYDSCNVQQRKESLWEKARRVEFGHLPTRRKALFLFDCPDHARRAREQWFPDESRHLLSARVVSTALLHRADARWLDKRESEWDLSARRYWSGELTDTPIVEVVL